MKKYRFDFLFLLLILGSQVNNSVGQSHEIQLSDYDNKGDVVIEMITEQGHSDEKRLMLGFNQSNEGWLRMRTEHDLSFWTNNVHRARIDSAGNFGIGTSVPLSHLHVQNGDMAIEASGFGRSQYGLFRNDDYIGALRFDRILMGNISSGFEVDNILSVDCQNNCITRMSTGGIPRINAHSSGKINIPDLSGQGTSRVVVKNDGLLQRSRNPIDEYELFIPTRSFVSKYGELRQLWTNGFNTSAYADVNQSIIILNNGLFCSPIIPHSRVLVTHITLRYYDNDENRDMMLKVIGDGQELSIESSGAVDGTRRLELDVNMEIDQSDFDLIELDIIGATDLDRRIYDARITYRPL